jgi:uncharacterized protein YndB with AHSA1/START domain
MIKNEKSIIIDRPIEEVFAFVGDLRNGLQWQSPNLLDVRRTTEGPLGIGTQYTSVRKLMGRKMQDNVEFVAYEPNKRLTFRSTSSSMPMETSHIFESTAEGTRLTTVIEMQPGGFMGLAEPLLAANLRRWMETHFGDLKDLLESREPAASL